MAASVVTLLVTLFAAEFFVGVDRVGASAVFVVWLIAFVALVAWRHRTQSEALGRVATSLAVGVLLAMLGLALNLLAERRNEARELERRQNEIRAQISSQQRFDFRGESLRDMDLSFLQMATGTSAFDFSFADLRGASLHGVSLRNAVLRGADLTAADLSDADLSGADLRGAALEDANLANAFLGGANLAGAAGVGGDDPVDGVDAVDVGPLRDAVLTEATICADGYGPRYSGVQGLTCNPAADAMEPARTQLVAVVAQDAAPGTVVARVRAEESAVYRVSERSPFEIDASGAIAVAGQLLDDSYEFLVLTGSHDPVRVRIEVEPPPPPGSPELAIVVARDTPLGAVVGRVQPPAPFPGASFSLLGQPPDELFDVHPDSGAITLVGRGQPGTAYTIVVEIDGRDGRVFIGEYVIEILE